MTEPNLLPCDIGLTAGHGFISRGIRVCTRTFGESRTKVNHALIVVGQGSANGKEVRNKRRPVIVEALHTVKAHTIQDAYGAGGNDLVVFRPKTLTMDQRWKICNKALGYEGRSYGYIKIALHFLDWLLLGAYVFRRLGRMDNYPICSYVVASAYAAAGLNFGCAPGAASPDDIYDYCIAHPEKYDIVRSLKPYPFIDNGDGRGNKSWKLQPVI